MQCLCRLRHERGSHPGAGRACDRRERRHAAALGPRGAHPHDARPAQPPARAAARGRAPAGPAGAPSHRRFDLRPQPLPRRGALVRVRRGYSADRDRGRVVTCHRGGDARRRRGARPGRGRSRNGDGEGDLGDGGARGVNGRTAAAVGLVVLALAGCGGGSSSGLKVSAAASLKAPLERLNVSGVDPRYQFAGSDELAAQIRAGARPDVYAAANTKLPAALAAAGLVEKPVVFARNRLVLAVPAGATKVSGLAGLERKGVTIAIGSPSVPVGSYTRQVLARLGPATSHRILANVRSNEPDVAGIVGKLTQGAVDAGFVYVTDVKAAGGKLRAIELPASLQPQVAY